MMWGYVAARQMCISNRARADISQRGDISDIWGRVGGDMG